MTTNYLKQITLATIGTGCIALGVATEAQASIGTVNISNDIGFFGSNTGIEFLDGDIEYAGSGVFSSFGTDADGSVMTGMFGVPGGSITSFFSFDDDSSTFDLDSITFVGQMGDFVMYDLMGTITDNAGTTYQVEGGLSSQMIGSPSQGSSWSATLETKRVPEPATVLGLGVVAVGSAFGLKKKNS
ncbi:MAG: PEP-CTERM sorting domain-containing protein [Okeania sp. SIO3B5]|uniref:PEP-CTERM sorting domain-containing protein n=1 Tax=Okeania sp. SIO3B5 TaxID=2607811 RepID=UPI0013FE5A08|nr:PEP-CTERM sorting domain-containing protein [Okeania sp. SIO3B5]NEO53368.1 PEP-CTERM sorting domain-containing protein [Okeania sp. SIO3B5]